jgi:hypothetical protein
MACGVLTQEDNALEQRPVDLVVLLGRHQFHQAGKHLLQGNLVRLGDDHAGHAASGIIKKMPGGTIVRE